MAGIAVIGDLMLGRHVHEVIEAEGLPFLLSDVRGAAAGRPLVANLESPLFDGRPLKGGTGPRFRAPTRRAAELAASGVAAVSLANNHIFDCGDEGLLATLRAASDAGLQTTGAGVDRASAMRPAIIDVDGQRFGLVSFSYRRPAGATAGVACLYDETVEDAICAARPLVDVLVALPHSGIELFRYPLPRDQRVYRRMIELGADVVVGGHSHCVQAMEEHRGRMIFYGIGDCLFDHHRDDVWERFWSETAHARRFGLETTRQVARYSLMLLIDAGAQRQAVIEIVPVRAEPRPRPLFGSERDTLMAEIRRLSDELRHDASVAERRTAIEAELMADLRQCGIA